jgi:hypothetical protein
MKIIPLLTFLLLAAPAVAQKRETSTDLTRARAAFNAADRNKDRRLNAREVGLAGIPHREFLSADDGDGEWVWQEFLSYYRGLLVQSGQKVHPDLEQEIALIRKGAKVKKAQKTSGTRVDTGGQSGADAALRKKLNEAKQELIERAVGGGATRSDQRAVAEGIRKVEERARHAGSTSGQAGDTPAADSGGAQTQRERLARQILEAQKVLQRVVRTGRLKPEEAREFYQVFLGRGVSVLRGSGDGSSDKAGPSMRERVSRLRGILQIHINSGRLTPAEARNINSILEERARNAVGAGSDSGKGGGETPGVSESGTKTLREKLQEAQERLRKRQNLGGADAGAARDAAQLLKNRARGAAATSSGEASTTTTSTSRNRPVVKKRLETPKPVPGKVLKEKERTRESPRQGRGSE